MNLPARADVTQEEEDAVYLTIRDEDDPAVLIGKHGQTLAALQLLSAMIVNRPLAPEERKRIILDAANYRARRERALEQMAHHAADRARRTGREVPLQPMGSRERRMIHMALADDANVGHPQRGRRTQPLRRDRAQAPPPGRPLLRPLPPAAVPLRFRLEPRRHEDTKKALLSALVPSWSTEFLCPPLTNCRPGKRPSERGPVNSAFPSPRPCSPSIGATTSCSLAHNARAGLTSLSDPVGNRDQALPRLPFPPPRRRSAPRGSGGRSRARGRVPRAGNRGRPPGGELHFDRILRQAQRLPSPGGPGTRPAPGEHPHRPGRGGRAGRPPTGNTDHLVLARALAPLPVLLEYGLPLTRLGGRLLAMKGPEVDAEIAASARAGETLGGRLCEVRRLSLPRGMGARRPGLDGQGFPHSRGLPPPPRNPGQAPLVAPRRPRGTVFASEVS